MEGGLLGRRMCPSTRVVNMVWKVEKNAGNGTSAARSMNVKE